MARVPRHIGVIPDGNRRWAALRGLPKEEGYALGLGPGLDLLRLCQRAGVSELTYYGFTVDNTRRPARQTRAFMQACIEAAELISHECASLRVFGNTTSRMFPSELLPYVERKTFSDAGIKVNLLVNYGWDWDLANLMQSGSSARKAEINGQLRSADISRIDLIIRWGGRRRLSGFLPVQSVYSDFYIVEEYWPDFRTEHFSAALEWYAEQDVTLGG